MGLRQSETIFVIKKVHLYRNTHLSEVRATEETHRNEDGSFDDIFNLADRWSVFLFLFTKSFVPATSPEFNLFWCLKTCHKYQVRACWALPPLSPPPPLLLLLLLLPLLLLLVLLVLLMLLLSRVHCMYCHSFVTADATAIQSTSSGVHDQRSAAI